MGSTSLQPGASSDGGRGVGTWHLAKVGASVANMFRTQSFAPRAQSFTPEKHLPPARPLPARVPSSPAVIHEGSSSGDHCEASHFLLAVDRDTFRGDAAKPLIEALSQSLLAHVPVVVVRMADEACNGVEHAQMLASTPRALLEGGLFRAKPVPWHVGRWQDASLTGLAQALGAKPLKGPSLEHALQRKAKMVLRLVTPSDRGGVGDAPGDSARNAVARRRSELVQSAEDRKRIARAVLSSEHDSERESA